MAVVTTTRGIGFVNDELDANETQQVAASVSGVTVASDGDILTWSGTFTNPNTQDGSIVYRAVSSLDTNIYTAAVFRARITSLSGGNLTLSPYIHYTNGTSQVPAPYLATATSNTFAYQNVNTVPARLIDRIGFDIFSPTTQNPATITYTAQLDFSLICKEVLTIPNVGRVFNLGTDRVIAVIPILGREGAWVQDLGSLSSDLVIQGSLVNTTAGVNNKTNTYTADQWWDVLTGLELEQGGTLNAALTPPVWQFWTSPRVNYKFLIRSIRPLSHVPRRLAWHDFAIQLIKYDINPATPQSWSSII